LPCHTPALNGEAPGSGTTDTFNAPNRSNAQGYVQSTRVGTGVGGGQPISFNIAGYPALCLPSKGMDGGFCPIMMV
jgi:hypothetical protein